MKNIFTLSCLFFFILKSWHVDTYKLDLEDSVMCTAFQKINAQHLKRFRLVIDLKSSV